MLSLRIQVVEYVIDLAAALWQAVPFAGHAGTGDLQDIIVSTKDMVCAPGTASTRWHEIFQPTPHNHIMLATASAMASEVDHFVQTLNYYDVCTATSPVAFCHH